MKKLTTVFILLIVFISFPMLQAQTGSGTMLLGVSSGINLAGEIFSGSDLMSIGFSTAKSKSNASGYTEPKPDKTINLNLIPKFGIFVINNLVVGLDVILAYNQTKEGEIENKYTQTLVTAGPFVRYYFPASHLLPFVEGTATFGSINWKYKSQSSSEESKYSIMSFGGGLGVAVPLGEVVTLDVMAGYTSATVKEKEDNPDDNRTVQGLFGIRLGLVVFLGKK